LNFGHSPLTPLPKIQNKKTKLKFFFRAIPIAIGIKVKHAHHIIRHTWLRLFTKASTQIAIATSDMPKRTSVALEKIQPLKNITS
jgi:hypothetical protein